MFTNTKSIHSENQRIIKIKSVALFKISCLPLIAALIFNSTLVLATQQRENNLKITVKSISYKIGKESEKVIIDFDRVTIPRVFDIEGKNPRVVIDIINVLPCMGRYRTPVNGKSIKQIRAYYHKDSEKLRVVLDLYSERDYILSQFQGSKKFLIKFNR